MSCEELRKTIVEMIFAILTIASAFPTVSVGLNMAKRVDMIPHDEIHLTSSVKA